MMFDPEELISILDGTEFAAQSDGPIADKDATNLHFDWTTTTQALRALDPSIKVAYKAKFLFACAISSFADDIMEYLLKEKRCTHITVSHMNDAFAHFNEPIGSFKLTLSKPLSLCRIMAKYRIVYKFELTSDAKKVFACVMTSLMIDIAMNIHTQRKHAKRTIQLNDVQNVTDPIVYIRDYCKKHTMSRSLHACKRVRKPNGRF